MLPKTAEYALRAAVWLGRKPKESESADRLAKAICVPRRYLHKVLQDLVKSGLVRSQPGPGGGYQLTRHPKAITILEVINAVGPIERIRSCPLGVDSHTSLCPLHQELDQAYEAMEKAFSRVTVAQVIERPSHAPPLCQVSAKRGGTP